MFGEIFPLGGHSLCFPFWGENTSFNGNQSAEKDSIKCRTEVNQRLGMNASKSSLCKCKSNIFRAFIASYHLFHVWRLMAAFITGVGTKCRKSKGERETKQNRLWSVVKQRNVTKVMTHISTVKKKLHPRAHSAVHYHKDIPQQWLWACRCWKQDHHIHAFLLLGLEVGTHSKWGSIIFMQHYIAQHEYMLGEGLKTDQLTQSCLIIILFSILLLPTIFGV